MNSSQAGIAHIYASLAFFLKPKGLGTGGGPHRGVQSIGFELGGIGRQGGARGEGGAEDQW